MAILNKRQLAHRLGISIPTLDQALLRNPDFPVISRGGAGREWRFDEGAALAFVSAKRNAAEAERQAREKHLRELAANADAPLLSPLRRLAGPA